MVSLALLAAALMAVADLAGNALRNHAYARDLSAATLLARAKMVELEQKYDDEGFKDFDEEERGDFSEEGRPDMTWKLELVKPDPMLSSEQLLGLITGSTGGDPSQLLSQLMGGAGATAAAGAATGAAGGAPSGPTSTNPLAGAMTAMLQTQLTAFGEIVKKSFREMRLEVAWRDGKVPHSFTVTTHLLVLNPKAPSGARGDNPDVPASIQAIPKAPAIPGTQAIPGAAKP
jgi:general secretion pathway protein I